MPRKKSRKRKKSKTKRSKPSWKTDEVKTGLIHINTGDGKGKTTAAIGLIVRASGHGLKCCFIQFMKGRYPYGEVKVLRKLKGITVKQFGTLDFVKKGKKKKVDVAEAKEALEYSRKAMRSGRYDIVVLDEVCVAEFMDLIEVEDIVAAIKDKAPKVEVVLTGRKASKRLQKLAHYITNFEKLEHPFDDGIIARKGIEF